MTHSEDIIVLHAGVLQQNVWSEVTHLSVRQILYSSSIYMHNLVSFLQMRHAHVGL